MHMLKTVPSSPTTLAPSALLPQKRGINSSLAQAQEHSQGGVGTDGPACGCLCHTPAGTQGGQELAQGCSPLPWYTTPRQTGLLVSYLSVFATEQQARVLGLNFPVKLRLRSRMGEGQGPCWPCCCGSRYRSQSASWAEGSHFEGRGCCVRFLGFFV